MGLVGRVCPIDYRATPGFCRSLFLRINDFLYFAGTKFCNCKSCFPCWVLTFAIQFEISFHESACNWQVKQHVEL